MVKPLVLLAPNLTAGILEAASDRRVNLLLMGWGGEYPPGDTPPDSILDPIGASLAVPMAIIMQAVLDNREERRWLAYMMGTGSEPFEPEGENLWTYPAKLSANAN